ncbi:Stabilin-2 [Fukomys damarensis]|uniref:Stabilin-2 n=1 Tax=Fukomys damarensis TaxID=885580 RepID=A0A091E5C8_FUKDA|nr:Stabilin-2 [Fukomys damarensis]
MLRRLVIILLGLVSPNSCSLAEATGQGNRCDKKSVLTFRTECQPCTLNFRAKCPDGYTKVTNLTVGVEDCSARGKEMAAVKSDPGNAAVICSTSGQAGGGPCKWRLAFHLRRFALPELYNSQCRVLCCGVYRHISYKDTVAGVAHYIPPVTSATEISTPMVSVIMCKCVHGTCNNGLHGDGTCECYSAYTGPNCDTPVPECAALLCPEHSRCSPLNEDRTKLRCRCLPNYRGDGKSCEPINPCLQQPCHPRAHCVYLGPNQHSCKCGDGYFGDGHVCLPLDPCQTGLGNCPPTSTVCKYDGPGQSHCECKQHFHHLVPGVGCSMTDLCKSKNPCHRNAKCTMMAPGQLGCFCQKGYVGDGFTCYGDIMQRLQELDTAPGGKWQGRVTSFISLLDGAYAWQLSGLGPFTLLLPAEQEPSSFNVTELLTDPEAARYFVKLHIIAGQMSTEQMNSANTFYTLTGASGEIFNQDEDHQIKLKLHKGKKKVKIIEQNIMASNGLIHILDRAMDKIEPTFKSNRKSIWTIQEVLKYHIVPLTQLEVATLVSMQQVMTMANEVIEFNITSNGQILVNGVAVEDTEITTKTGLIYTLTGGLVPPSFLRYLSGNKPGDVRNRCNGIRREMRLGSCVSCLAMFTSKCPADSEPTALFTHKCVYRSRSNALKSGCARYCNATVTCADGIHGNGTCICKDGFYGSQCQFCSDRNKYGFKCEKKCLCVLGTCDNRIASSGACLPDTCQKGSSGTYCDRGRTRCNYFTPECHVHATCQVIDQMRRCVCNDGYEGDDFLCSEKDPCTDPPRGGCSHNAECIKTGPGSHTCVCHQGWTGSGMDCEAINPCLLPGKGSCHSNATCLYMGPGQHECECQEGFRGDGTDCEPIISCLEQPGKCHPLATCQIVASGVWSCVCREGYEGDGTLCYGDVATKASLQPLLSSLSKLTILVPSREAIEDMDRDEKNFWLSRPNLPVLIKYHMVLGTYGLADLQDLTSSDMLATSLPGGFVHLGKADRNVTVGGASIIDGDNVATNGVIHIIDKHYDLASVIEDADTYTVFAPNNAAIEKYIKEKKVATLVVPAGWVIGNPQLAAVLTDRPGCAMQEEDTLRYHVVLEEKLLRNDLHNGRHRASMLGPSYLLGFFLRSDQLYVNDAPINYTNIATDKGVIHGLGKVLEIQKNRCDNNETTTVRGKCAKCLQQPTCPPGAKPLGNEKNRCVYSLYFLGKRSVFIGCRPICVRTVITPACCAGFFGPECQACPGERGSACFGNGVCMDGVNGTGACKCDPGFHGTACETCADGKYGVHCDQVCSCVHGRCSQGPSGDGSCDCAVGWRGVRCDSGSSHLEAGEEEVPREHPEDPEKALKHLSAQVKQGPDLQKKNNVWEESYAACNCLPTYSGDGKVCTLINVCLTKNGGCSPYAICNHTEMGERTCTCKQNYTGDGFTCRGSIYEELPKDPQTSQYFFQLQEHAVRELAGPGPFTVFVPSSAAFDEEPQIKHWPSQGLMPQVLRYHVVACHQLLLENLKLTPNVTSLQGEPIVISTSQDTVYVNNRAKVISGNIINTNGVVHVIDKLLSPRNLLFSPRDAAGRVLDSGLLRVITNPIHTPVTLFWPTDHALEALPQEQRDFLFSPDSEDKLKGCLKFHVIRDAKVLAADLPRSASWKTLQGSELSVKCGAGGDIGELFLNGQRCRIVQRELLFDVGVAYGIDCLLTDPSLGGRCDTFTSFSVLGTKQKCSYRILPFRSVLEGCRNECTLVIQLPRCCSGYFLPDCQACGCSEHGQCEDGISGSGHCLCESGWTGRLCDTHAVVSPVCTPPCSAHATCMENNTCECDLNYEGDGLTCTVVDFCKQNNGGCAKVATCSQKDTQVSCNCPTGYQGDGYSCTEIDLCTDGLNGGCHEHATCRMTARGRYKCECKSHYVGDGLDCEPEQLPLDRCLQDNGSCAPDADCVDLHFQDATAGVFHIRSPLGQYKLTFDDAVLACTNEAAAVATFTQLSYAQKAGYHLCSAGWLDSGHVAYPTAYASQKCGGGTVGIVNYGVRPNKSETWDVFCYRMKDVNCTCRPGYVGNGMSCSGNLLQVLMSNPLLKNFLTEVLAYSSSSARGRAFLKHLTDLSTHSTLFVPFNSGLGENETLSGRDIEHHLTSVSVVFYNDFVNGTTLWTRLGSRLLLTTSHDQTDPKTWFVDGRAILLWDIFASNGVIHIISGPLKAPPEVTHAGLGMGIFSAIILVTAAVALAAYSYFRLNRRAFRFRHLESEQDVDIASLHRQPWENVSNPAYESTASPQPPPPACEALPELDSSNPLGAATLCGSHESIQPSATPSGPLEPAEGPQL